MASWGHNKFRVQDKDCLHKEIEKNQKSVISNQLWNSQIVVISLKLEYLNMIPQDSKDIQMDHNIMKFSHHHNHQIIRAMLIQIIILTKGMDTTKIISIHNNR